MFEKLEKFMLKLMYLYHHNVANYCFKKIDEYGPENNERWMEKTAEHTRKELDIAARFLS